MANLSFVILPAQANAQGECVVKLRVQHNGEKKYISSNVKCKTDAFRAGRVTGIGSGSKNKDLDIMMARITKIYNAIDFPDGLSCGSLVKLLKLGTNDDGKDVRRTDEQPSVDPSGMYMMSGCDGSAVFGKRRTMKSVFEEFLQLYDKDKTVKVYTNAWKKWCEYAGENFILQDLTAVKINTYIKWLKTQKIGVKKKRHLSDTTIRMYSTNLKVLVNYAEKMGYVRFFPHPWATAKVPRANVRDSAVTVDEMRAIRDLDLRDARYGIRVSRDLFMLTYYLGGMNLCDILKINWKEVKRNDRILTYQRTKTEEHKRLNDSTSFTVQPEAWEIIDRYMLRNGKVAFGKKFTRSSADSCLNWNMSYIKEAAGIKGQFTLYSARKSFAQHGYALTNDIVTIEYCLGHVVDSNRSIFDYVTLMREHADVAIRKIIDNLFADVRN